MIIKLIIQDDFELTSLSPGEGFLGTSCGQADPILIKCTFKRIWLFTMMNLNIQCPSSGH